MRRTVVVTGGSAGIGRATVREFARNGADVAILARGQERLDAAVREVEAAGSRALGIAVDVADGPAVEAAAERVERELGSTDVWVNNAFAGIFSTFMDMSWEEYERVTAVTYFGQIHGTRAALKRMLPRDRGTIVLVGSALAYRGIPLQSAYCGAKHALQGFLDSIRPELEHRGSKVHVTMVQLPAVNTPQFDWARARIDRKPRPVGKIYQPEAAARAIRFAADARRKEVWVGSTTVRAIGGDRVASPLIDHMLAGSGISGQSSPEPLEGDREDNLFEPPRGDPGAHGRFDREAVEKSWQMALNRRRNGVLAGVGLAAAALLIARARKYG
ncbi:SDR family oxidoreductase [Pelagerythrobacter rhizovicinus]|uniref:SDR family NAD(P)-dependent oxidoreductase n=1 Tax=Pelagerythrobacter rhizovicinus TaxID=2268576 RepID=A0A4Q2KNH4_9SPHN|nr:SDR family oxidoreductase [Pelagerythrobacter rhizovicinus]RXZ65860.1 SDR family NAD(P)-dependent oxidoreductase [Pelagerythrobacter rhizovicinus]